MKTRHQRIALILGGLAILGAVVALVLNAFQSNLVFFFSPSQVAANEAPSGRTFRIGGLVEQGSIVRQKDALSVSFKVTDGAHAVPVRFTGVLPDLFQEGQGMIGTGKMEGETFVATEILAKHDENYKPPQMAGSEHKTETLAR